MPDICAPPEPGGQLGVGQTLRLDDRVGVKSGAGLSTALCFLFQLLFLVPGVSVPFSSFILPLIKKLSYNLHTVRVTHSSEAFCEISAHTADKLPSQSRNSPRPHAPL